MKKYLVEESNYRHDLNRVGKNNNTYRRYKERLF